MKKKLTKKKLKELFETSSLVHYDARTHRIDDYDDENAYLYDADWECGITVNYEQFIKEIPDDLAFYKVQKVYPNEEEK